METFILQFIPSLQNQPLLLVITSILFSLFFGGFVFSAFWGLLNDISSR